MTREEKNQYILDNIIVDTSYPKKSKLCRY